MEEKIDLIGGNSDWLRELWHNDGCQYFDYVESIFLAQPPGKFCELESRVALASVFSVHFDSRVKILISYVIIA